MHLPTEKRVYLRNDLFGCGGPGLDRFVRPVEVEEREMCQMGRDQAVGGFTGEPAAGDSHLHDIDTCGYHVGHRWRIVIGAFQCQCAGKLVLDAVE